MVEPETPVRRDAFGLLGGALRIRQRQRGAVVDRRQPAAQLDLALEIEFLRGLVRGIDAPVGAQFLERRFVGGEAQRLALLTVRFQTQPRKVGADRIDIFLAAALRIGVVDAQDESAAGLAGQHPVVQRGADVADMQAAGRRRGETGGGHARRYRRFAAQLKHLRGPRRYCG